MNPQPGGLKPTGSQTGLEEVATIMCLLTAVYEVKGLFYESPVWGSHPYLLSVVTWSHGVEKAGNPWLVPCSYCLEDASADVADRLNTYDNILLRHRDMPRCCKARAK